jgi:D-psicose/D-tagatose/L-ribulose 3-epimerase
MRFGCCLNTLSTAADGTGAERAPLLAAAGYDYLELSLAHIMALQADDRKRALAPALESGLPCEACNNFFPPSLRLTGPSADPGRALAYAAEALALARSLGVRVVVFGSGKARNPPEGFPREQAWDQLVDFARELAPLAAEHSITIAMEALNRGESDILCSFSELIRFVREVNLPNLRALMDSYHLGLEKESADTILQGRGLLAHTHVARLAERSWPLLPSPELRAVFAALAAIGYDGGMSIEGYTEKLDEHCRLSLAMLRRLARDSHEQAGMRHERS